MLALDQHYLRAGAGASGRAGALGGDGPMEAAALDVVLLGNELAMSPRNGLPLPGNCSSLGC